MPFSATNSLIFCYVQLLKNVKLMRYLNVIALVFICINCLIGLLIHIQYYSLYFNCLASSITMRSDDRRQTESKVHLPSYPFPLKTILPIPMVGKEWMKAGDDDRGVNLKPVCP